MKRNLMQAVLIAAALWPSTMAAKDFIYIIGSDVEGKYNNYPDRKSVV